MERNQQMARELVFDISMTEICSGVNVQEGPSIQQTLETHHAKGTVTNYGA